MQELSGSVVPSENPEPLVGGDPLALSTVLECRGVPWRALSSPCAQRTWLLGMTRRRVSHYLPQQMHWHQQVNWAEFADHSPLSPTGAVLCSPLSGDSGI